MSTLDCLDAAFTGTCHFELSNGLGFWELGTALGEWELYCKIVLSTSYLAISLGH
jgi:hypothetical protein